MAFISSYSHCSSRSEEELQEDQLYPIHTMFLRFPVLEIKNPADVTEDNPVLNPQDTLLAHPQPQHPQDSGAW
jgi:hypothetical protein